MFRYDALLGNGVGGEVGGGNEPKAKPRKPWQSRAEAAARCLMTTLVSLLRSSRVDPRPDFRAEISQVFLLLSLSGIILTADLHLPAGRAVIVLFVLVIILAGAFHNPRVVLSAVLAGCLMTTGGYIFRHGWVFHPAYVARRLFSIVAILVTGLLVVRNQAIQRRRSGLAALLDLTGNAMFVRGIDGRITWWNRWAEQLYGWTRQQVLGRPVGDVLGDGGGQHDWAATNNVMRNGAWEGELRHRHRDGREIDVLSRWTLQTDATGRSVGILETNTDITQEKSAAAEMRRSEDRHRQIFETGGAAILELDHSAVQPLLDDLRAKGTTDMARHLNDNPAFALEVLDLVHVIDVNQTALTMFQATSKDQLRHALRGIVPAETASLSRGLLAAWVDGHPSFDAETTLQTVRGETRTVLISVTFPTEQLTNFLLCMIDITERRRAETELRLLQEELAVAARVATLGELTSSIARDVDQPIAELSRHARNGLNALRMPYSDIQTVCDSIGRVVSEGRRAAEIIARVRDFLRKSGPTKSAADLNAIVAAALSLTRHEIADRQVALHLTLAAGLPMLDGDGPLLEHVVVNLILNGIQSMLPLPAQGRVLTVETALQGAELVLCVKDNGRLCETSGIDRLFDPVFTNRPDGTRRDIGLSVCRASVEAQGGRIWATPGEAGGTIVHIALPAASHRAQPATSEVSL